MPETLIYSGGIYLSDHGEACEILFIDTLDEPIADELQYKIDGKNVSVRYWITDQKCTKEEAQESFLKTVMGVAECNYCSRYSEITGYLWTDDDLMIGGHDLHEEISSNAGKYLILEIDIHA